VAATLAVAMSNGTKPGVLLSELFSGDGPYVAVAEDFVAAVCAGCGRTVDRNGVHDGRGYYCSTCWAPRIVPG
jgi:hypothetical protein